MLSNFAKAVHSVLEMLNNVTFLQNLNIAYSNYWEIDKNKDNYELTVRSRNITFISISLKILLLLLTRTIVTVIYAFSFSY